MDDSKKSEIFTFGQLEDPEDSASEESLSDSSDEESGSNNHDATISSKTDVNQVELVKEMLRLTSRVLPNSSNVASSDSNDFFKRRMMDYNGSNTHDAQPRSSYGTYPERREVFRKDQRGSWSLKCDAEERNLDGLTEADIAWTKVKELHKKEAGIFTFRPRKISSTDGFVFIHIYTPDYRHEEFILKTASIIRRYVSFPYVMYYFKSGGKATSSYMNTPNGEFYKKNDFNKWAAID